MVSFDRVQLWCRPSALAIAALAAPMPALAQDGQPAQQPADQPGDQTVDETLVGEAAVTPDEATEDEAPPATDILSANTLSLIADVRVVLADGHRSWIEGGFGKTRFDGTNDEGDMQLHSQLTELSLIWQPQFTRSLNANVSAAYQHGFDDEVFDVMEGFVTFNPSRKGNTNFSAKAGYYWPEISLEHATGGAWSTVYTLTPSAINSWVGEEVKVIGAEATLYQTIGSQDFSLTAGAFGFNDTSGTLLSFRGWALHDIKSTLFGQFPLPPRSPFMERSQEDVTRSVAEIDDRVGFYGRLEWRPSPAIVLNAFYYDNRGDPEAFTESLQWGWRTRFWNVGLVADLGPKTRFIAQGMTGTTLMGLIPRGETRYWVDTRYRSAFALLTHQIGPGGALTGRFEVFDTNERGSRMVPADENEDGWAATVAGRWPVADMFTLFVEALHMQSTRGTRERLGIPPKETQTVLQAALRFRW